MHFFPFRRFGVSFYFSPVTVVTSDCIFFWTSLHFANFITRQKTLQWVKKIFQSFWCLVFIPFHCQTFCIKSDISISAPTLDYFFLLALALCQVHYVKTLQWVKNFFPVFFVVSYFFLFFKITIMYYI